MARSPYIGRIQPGLKPADVTVMNYPTPFPREEAAERLFARKLSTPGGAAPEADLLLVGRQFEVYGGPERLDLLALDREGVPWVFEFKRDIAMPEAIGQLLSYGAFAAALTCGELCQRFAEQHKNTTLPEAFPARFDRALPERHSGKVNLVLAAFGFSSRCNRVISFLERGAGLVIGQMTTKLLPLAQPRALNFELTKSPQPTRPIGQPIGDEQPEEYFLLSVEEPELALDWEGCRQQGKIALGADGVPRHRAPGRNSGLFVYLRSHGLVGYGIVTKRGQIQDPAVEGGTPAGASRTWEAQVSWRLTHPWGDAVLPMAYVPTESGLFQMTNPEQVTDFRVSLGVG
jgi:hypothetical protein